MTTNTPKCFICGSDNVGWAGKITICIDCFHLPHSSFMLRQKRTIQELRSKLERVESKPAGGGTG